MSGSEPETGPEHRAATPPRVEDRLPVRVVDPPHPSTLDPDTLWRACEFRAQRRGGPGGQHRNKTSSGVFLEHRPTGVVAEATERRSQGQNRSVAVHRLRLLLAVTIRTRSASDRSMSGALSGEAPVPAEETAIRERYRGTRLKLADQNADRPAVIAVLLNDLHAAGGQPSLVAGEWGVTTTSIVNLLRSHPPALVLVNAVRRHHGRPPLRAGR